jgi:hypothetical protein
MTEHPYELLVNSLLALHLLGFGTIFGYAVTQIPNFKTGAKVQPGLIHGTWLSLVTALAMVGVAPMNNDDLNYMSVSLKSIVITAIFFIAYTYRKSEKTPKWVVPSILGLVVFNVLVATIMGMMSA